MGFTGLLVAAPQSAPIKKFRGLTFSDLDTQGGWQIRVGKTRGLLAVPPSPTELDGMAAKASAKHPVLFGYVQDSDWAFIAAFSAGRAIARALVESDVAGDFEEGIEAMSLCRELHGLSWRTSGPEALAEWSTHAPIVAGVEQVREALTEGGDESPFAEDKVFALFAAIGLQVAE
jgi:hypothetical protein